MFMDNPEKSIDYTKIVDNIFAIVQSGRPDINNILTNLSNLHRSIEFTNENEIGR